jgi:hypothetical protein
MRRINFSLILVIFLALSSNARAQTAAAFRALFGVAETSGASWDGSLKVTEAGQYSLEPWRFEGTDKTDGESFRFSTRRARFVLIPLVANGFVVSATCWR